MKLHSLISAVVLGMAAHVQAQADPILPPNEPEPLASGGAPQTKPVPKVTTDGAPKKLDVDLGVPIPKEASPIPQPTVKPPRPTAEMSVMLSAGKLSGVVAEIEEVIRDWALNGGAEPEPVMPNIIFSADSRDAAVPGSLRLRGVSPVQALALACAAAGCAMEPIFAPAGESASPGKPQQIIGYRIVREPAKARDPMTTAKQYVDIGSGSAKIGSDLAAARAKLQSLREAYGRNHPGVIASDNDLLQVQRSLEAAVRETAATIPAIVRGRLLDKDGKPLGKRPLAFYVKDGTNPTGLIADGPTNDDGTFQFELPVDKQWQAVFRENDKSPGLRSEAMQTPVADRSSAEPNYDLELRVDGARLEASLKPLTPKFTFNNEIVGGIGITLSKKDDGGVVETIFPGSPVSTYPEIKPGQRILGVAELGRPTIDTTSISVENLVALLRGTPGTSVNVTFGIGSDKGVKKHTVQLVRAGLPIPSPKVTALGGGIGMESSLGGDIGFTAPQTASNNPTSGLPLLMDNERQTVHVHALGNVLGGSNEESARKQALCQELIAATLHQAELNSKTSPSLSFHRDSRVLVVKATAAQHEMIGQVIKALKENEIQPVQKAGDLKNKPIEPMPEVIKPPGI